MIFYQYINAQFLLNPGWPYTKWEYLYMYLLTLTNFNLFAKSPIVSSDPVSFNCLYQDILYVLMIEMVMI